MNESICNFGLAICDLARTCVGLSLTARFFSLTPCFSRVEGAPRDANRFTRIIYTTWDISLTPRLQPGGRTRERSSNCFNSLSSGTNKPLKLKRLPQFPSGLSRAEAAVLMRQASRTCEIFGLSGFQRSPEAAEVVRAVDYYSLTLLKQGNELANSGPGSFARFKTPTAGWLLLRRHLKSQIANRKSKIP